MSKQLAKQEFDMDMAIADLDKMQSMCQQLMKSKHYASMGEVGIFAVVQKARSVGLNPLDALNGGMYYVQGKVELTAQTMNYLIRAAGHSITKDPKSDKNCCILQGKRADNGDTWIVSFSIEDAKKAGIYRNQWEKYTEDMLFARALSRLARQLFPDVIKGCYVEGEIRDADSIETEPLFKSDSKPDTLTVEQMDYLQEMFVEIPEYADQVMNFMKKPPYNIELICDIPSSMFDRIVSGAKKHLEKMQKNVREEGESLSSDEVSIEVMHG